MDRVFQPDYSLRQGIEYLSVVATMIANHVVNLEKIRIEQEKLKNENKRLRNELENKYRFNNIVGNSNKMREVYQMISTGFEKQCHGADSRGKRYRQGAGGQFDSL